MKKILHIIFLLSVSANCQNLSSDQLQILNLELSNIRENQPNNNLLKKIIGDSLPISKYVNHYKPLVVERGLKEWCINSQELTLGEANEIFGNGDVIYLDAGNSKTTWLANDFSDSKIAFFDSSKKGPEKNALERLYNIFSLSIPSVRSDGNFGYIHVADSGGGQLRIYKKIDGQWHFYKSVWLYLI